METTTNKTTERLERVLSKYNASKYSRLRDQWRPDRHEVNSEAHRPNDRILKEDAYTDATGAHHPAIYETRRVSRIASSLEQNIVETHTAFAVGLDPDLQANAKGQDEEHMLELIRETEVRNKVRFLNQRAVRSVLSETMVAEYWYAVEDAEFYLDKPWAGNVRYRLRCEVWSPFRGDQLIPESDTAGNLVRFWRFYTLRSDDGEPIYRAMEIDSERVRLYQRESNDWRQLSDTPHGFERIPVVYMQIDEALCERIQSQRRRIEELESNFADCINENFFPKVLLRGMMSGIQRTGKTQVVQMSGEGADVRYLTWDQSTAAAEGELERLVDECYTLTLTPRISPKDLQGLGSALSGVAFKYVFMGAHIAVRKHEEFIGEYLARRYSFLKHALSLLVPSVAGGVTLKLDPVLVPFTIEDSTLQAKE